MLVKFTHAIKNLINSKDSHSKRRPSRRSNLVQPSVTSKKKTKRALASKVKVLLLARNASMSL